MCAFDSTNRTVEFEEWAEQFELLAELNGQPILDIEEWREDYNNGLTTIDAFFNAFPENESDE